MYKTHPVDNKLLNEMMKCESPNVVASSSRQKQATHIHSHESAWTNVELLTHEEQMFYPTSFALVLELGLVAHQPNLQFKVQC